MAYSFSVFVASGSSPNVPVTFGYLKKSEVHVKIDGVQVDDADLEWSADDLIVLPENPTAGAAVRVYRDTGIDALNVVYSTPNVFDHRDWNGVLTQLLYVTQEAFDLGDATATALEDITSYVNTAMAAAAESASNAATSETNAAASASAASLSAAAALSSANTAAGVVAAALDNIEAARVAALSDVANSTSDASAYAALAQKWATELEDVEVTTGKYSAYHWAQKAADIIADGVTAGIVPFTPAGTIAANNVQDAIEELDGDISGKAANSEDFLVKTASGNLSAERVVTDTTSLTWDWAAAGQAKANVVFASQAEAEAGSINTKSMSPLRTAQAIAALSSGVPIGGLVNFPCTSPPTGFLKRNGALLSRTTYAALWTFANGSGNIVSEASWSSNKGAFSTGDGSTTFRLPDARGIFERNWDDGAGVDSGRTIGSSQADDLKAHTHTDNYRPDNFAYPQLTEGGPGPRIGPTASTTSGSAGGAETRPKNTASLACIRAY